LKTLNTLAPYTALALFLVSCWDRNEFPQPMLPDGEVPQAPVQTAVDERPFAVSNNGVEYWIEPR
jgi:hypothetical protein